MKEHDITQLLIKAGQGDQQAASQLMDRVYDELRHIASNYMRAERRGHTLDTTALVHEAYLRLIGNQNIQWQNRAHFFALASQAMRRVLIDWARKYRAAKRGAGKPKVELEKAAVFVESQAEEYLALDEALNRLEKLDQRQSKIIELRFFGGLTIEEVARVLNISPATVKREWSLARAWLYKQVRGNTG